MSSCPRCAETTLTENHGVLHEAVCPSCDGRFLDASSARQVIEDELGIPIAQLRELAALFGGLSLTCPTCVQPTRPVTLRGVPIDVCFHCGGVWCDAGELCRLSSGKHREISIDEHHVGDAPTTVAPEEVGSPAKRRLRTGGAAIFLADGRPLNPDMLWDVFCDYAQYSRQDMRHLATRHGGILLTDTCRGDAEEIVAALQTHGVQSSTDDTRWAQAPRTYRLRRMVVFDEGLRFIDMHQQHQDLSYEQLLGLNVGIVGGHRRAEQVRASTPSSRSLVSFNNFKRINTVATAQNIYQHLRSTIPRVTNELRFDVIAHDGRVQVSQGSAIEIAGEEHTSMSQRLIHAVAKIISLTRRMKPPPVYGPGFVSLDENGSVPTYAHTKLFDTEAAWVRWRAHQR